MLRMGRARGGGTRPAGVCSETLLRSARWPTFHGLLHVWCPSGVSHGGVGLVLPSVGEGGACAVKGFKHVGAFIQGMGLASTLTSSNATGHRARAVHARCLSACASRPRRVRPHRAARVPRKSKKQGDMPVNVACRSAMHAAGPCTPPASQRTS